MITASYKRCQKLRRLYEAAVRDRNTERFYEDFDQALEAKQVRLEDYSIRGLFEQLVPNGRELADSWRGGEGGYSLLEAGDAVSSGVFAKISGQVVYNAIMEAFQSEQFVFTPLVRTIPTGFDGERIAGITRIGDQAQIVEEGQPYPMAGVSQDYIDTPKTFKRGMKVALTKEAIFFDRTGLIMMRCAEVGEFLGLNKEKRIIDCVIDENTTTHRYKWRDNVIATYGNNSGTHSWDNLEASNALVDWTDVDAAEKLMAAILDPNTGEPVMISPKHLVVTRDLLYTARRIVNATEITVNTPGYATSGNPTNTTTKNPVQGYTIVSSQLLAARMATDTNWFIGDIGKAFAYMENWPLTVTQAPPNSQDEFDRDVVMQWKSSERGAAATLEPRAMVECTA